MRARGRKLAPLVALIAALTGVARAGPQGPHIAGVKGGPHAATAGPAIASGPAAGAGGVVVIVPSAGAADVNCPATIPTENNQVTLVSTISTAITCPTPARATNVVSISFWAQTGTSGSHQKCSVYTFPPGYVSGTTAIPKVAPGCDTVEWTAPGPTMNAWVTLATTGACPLAASTRYQIGCNQDNGYFMYFNGTSCSVSGAQCDQYRTATYATAALPDPWTATNQSTGAYSWYLSVQ